MQQSHKFLEIQNPMEALILPPIGIKSPSPMNDRLGGDMNLIMKPNHKRVGGHFHQKSRSNAVNAARTGAAPTQKQTQTPMRSRYREEFDLKTNKYNTINKYGREDSTEAQRKQAGSVQAAMAHNISHNSLSRIDSRNENHINIVPCRWSNSGWRYTMEDPTEEKYFRSPNRVNRFGHKAPTMGTIEKQQINSQLRQHNTSQLLRLAQNQHQYADVNNKEENDSGTHYKSSYQLQYSKKGNNKLVNWQENFHNGEFGAQKSIKDLPADKQLILWGGGMHHRADFKKKRNENTEFTDMLFRN